MLDSPDFVIACPHCQAPARIFQLAIESEVGAITWSDGYRDLPMLPRPPRITCCHACGKAFWVGEGVPLGYYFADNPEAPKVPAWTDAPYVTPLDEAGVFKAIDDGLAYNADLELELRVLAWWRGNDAFRKDDALVGHATSPTAIANMERFIEMMTGGEEDLLLFRAEALRQLGRFDEVAETLTGVYCSDYLPAKTKLLDLSKAGDRKLRVLFSTESVTPPPET